MIEIYPAIVTSNEDEEQRGRIQCACAGLMGDEETPLPQWIEPKFDWGWFYVPDVGEIVELEVIAGTEQDEQFGQSSIDNLDIHWCGRRSYTDAEGDDDGDAPEERQIHDDFVAEAYAKRRGFATPWGHIFMFDDTEGTPRIWLTWMKEQLEQGEAPEAANYTRVEIEPDGSFKVGLLAKHYFHIQTEDNQMILSLDEEKHKLTLNPDMFESIVGEGNNIKVEAQEADAVCTIGDGAVSAVQAEHLKAWLDDTYTPAIADMHDNHIHPLPQFIAPLIPLSAVPCVPGGPPAPPSEAPVMPAMLESYDDGITSTHLVFPED